MNRQNWPRLFRQVPAISLEHFLPISLMGFPASFSSDLTEPAARFIYEQRGEFDLIVISGDLATTGHVEYLQTARAYTHGDATNGYLMASGEATLPAENKKKLFFPGNHDRFRTYSGASADPHFELVFTELWNPPITVRVLEKDGSFLAIIGADFCLRRDGDAGAIVAINRAGRGYVYDDVMERLIATTQTLRKRYSEISIIWAVHFPPTENCPPIFKLIRTAILEDAAEENFVQMFMAGHLHRNVEYRTRHGKPVLCAGTLASSGGDSFNWLHVIELEVEGSRIVSCEKQDYRWDDDDGDFVPMTTRQISLAAMV